MTDHEHLMRMTKIFTALEQGRTTPEIHLLLAAESGGRAGNKLGAQSEIRVVEALSKHPYVQHAERTQQNSNEDRAGIDVFVYLRPSVDEINPVIGVQVKSSQQAIAAFRRRIGRMIESDDPIRVDQWLRDSRLVLVNGQMSQGHIRRSFQQQVSGTYSFAA